MVRKIFLDLDENKYIVSWGSSPVNENSIQVEIEEEHPFFSRMDFNTWYINDKKELFQDKSKIRELAIEDKLSELSIDCQSDILNGFDYELSEAGVFHFFYSETDQTNMIQNKYALEMGEESVPWRVYSIENNEPIDFSFGEEVFNDIFKTAVREKNKKLKLLREYYPDYLTTLNTVEEISEVKWNSNIELG